MNKFQTGVFLLVFSAFTIIFGIFCGVIIRAYNIMVLFLILSLPPIAIGIYMIWISKKDQKEFERRRANGQLISVSYSMGFQGINGWVSGCPNSANGASVKFNIQNWSEKTIKYYTVYFIPYNAVGDPERCSICHESERGVRGVGPIPPLGSVTDCLFENAWYNPLIRSVRATKAVIEFTNGTTATVKL